MRKKPTRAGCDAILKKPFEASKVMETIHPLVKEAQLARGLFAEASWPPLPLRLAAEPVASAPAAFRSRWIPSAFAPPSPWRWTPRSPP